MNSDLRILIVDDEPAAIRRLEHLCADIEGVAVVGVASDGSAALGEMRHTEVDLVLLDIEMPGMSGMELAGQLVD